jgi:NAD(P)-dependent dehydrogenase (short-subunit alcohol dehydrogenase family)
MNKLQNKIAVITGGASGMGLATAKLFAEEGAHVFIFGRRQEELNKAVALIGRNVTAVQGDVSKQADLDRLYETVKSTKRRVDVLFANAGIGEFAPIGQITEDHLDRVLSVNVKGTLFTVQTALPLLPDGASIILNGSVASIKGFAGMGAYSATKAAVRSFARTWANELKDRKIRVNVLSPGTIDTPILAPLPKEAVDHFVSLIPRGSIGKPEEIAATALFLASDDSSFIDGVELFVDGGTFQI